MSLLHVAIGRSPVARLQSPRMRGRCGDHQCCLLRVEYSYSNTYGSRASSLTVRCCELASLCLGRGGLGGPIGQRCPLALQFPKRSSIPHDLELVDDVLVLLDERVEERVVG
eukprot:COSAG03_NODE_86_length_13617_cov_15.756843_6_plen_112_part_00